MLYISFHIIHCISQDFEVYLNYYLSLLTFCRCLVSWFVLLASSGLAVGLLHLKLFTKQIIFFHFRLKALFVKTFLSALMMFISPVRDLLELYGIFQKRPSQIKYVVYNAKYILLTSFSPPNRYSSWSKSPISIWHFFNVLLISFISLWVLGHWTKQCTVSSMLSQYLHFGESRNFHFDKLLLHAIVLSFILYWKANNCEYLHASFVNGILSYIVPRFIL